MREVRSCGTLMRTMKTKIVLLFCVLACALGAVAQEQKAAAEPWAPLQFLVGKWSGVTGGEPGQGGGWTTFEFDLNKHLLVRKNHVSFEATKDRRAFSHDDLLITYKEPGTQGFRADYWDSEGHSIHYTATLSSDGKTMQYVSVPAAGQPAFRLTYIKVSGDEFKSRFEIAPPDKPNEFTTHVEGTAKRLALSPPSN